MMARFGCTVTVDTGKMPSSQSDFSWLLTEDNFPTAAVDGGTDSILNGGGNLRCYTDDTKTTQLAIEVVSFVTGGTPSVQVWGLSATLNVGDTVYIEADTVETAQPAVTDTFGRNAVWAAFDHKISGQTDVTGNSSTTIIGVGVTQSGTIKGFPALNNDGTDGACLRLDDTDGESWLGDMYVSAWINSTTFRSFAQIFGIRQGNEWEISYRTEGNNQGFLVGTTSPESSTSLSTGVDYFLAAVINGTDIDYYVNGDFTDSTSVNGTRVNRVFDITLLGIETATNNTSVNGSTAETKAINGGFKIADYIKSEYNNQSSPSTFWTTSAWEDQDSGGTSIPVIMNQYKQRRV
jgi:hypothetical protein